MGINSNSSFVFNTTFLTQEKDILFFSQIIWKVVIQNKTLYYRKRYFWFLLVFVADTPPWGHIFFSLNFFLSPLSPSVFWIENNSRHFLNDIIQQIWRILLGRVFLEQTGKYFVLSYYLQEWNEWFCWEPPNPFLVSVLSVFWYCWSKVVQTQTALSSAWK